MHRQHNECNKQLLPSREYVGGGGGTHGGTNKHSSCSCTHDVCMLVYGTDDQSDTQLLGTIPSSLVPICLLLELSDQLLSLGCGWVAINKAVVHSLQQVKKV